MSKWNVRTATGEVADVSTIKQAQVATARDYEAANPTYKFGSENTVPKAALWTPPPVDASKVTGGEGCMYKCGRFLDTRKGKATIACCLCSILIAVILGAVLYPRFPVVDIDRNATIDGTKIDSSSNVTRIFGNVTMIINNPNLYPINLVGMELNGTIGKVPTNQLNFYQEVGRLDIAGNGRSSHVVPFDLTIPPEIDKVALLEEITRECVLNLNKMKISMVGKARVNVVGAIIGFQFGPQIFENRCI